jgi:hypothetical protein
VTVLGRGIDSVETRRGARDELDTGRREPASTGPRRGIGSVNRSETGSGQPPRIRLASGGLKEAEHEHAVALPRKPSDGGWAARVDDHGSAVRIATALLFALAGVINFLPVVGVISADQVEKLYGVTLSSPDLALLMRHRAILFAIVGGLLLAAAVRREWRTVAAFAGFASMLSYLALAAGEPAINAELRRIATVDVVGVLALAAGALLHWRWAELSRDS